MDFSTAKTLYEFEQSEKVTIKFRMVKAGNDYFLDIRKHLTGEKYTGPTKQGIMLNFECLVNVAGNNIIDEAIDFIDSKTGKKKNASRARNKRSNKSK